MRPHDPPAVEGTPPATRARSAQLWDRRLVDHHRRSSAGWLRLPHALAPLWHGSSRSRDGLELAQGRALAALVRHAHEHVPFYRQRMRDAGVRPEDITTLADLGRLPVITKEMLRGRESVDVVARGLDPERLLTTATSGSTGRPTRIHKAWLEQKLQHLFRLRALRQLGVGLRDRVAEIDPLYPAHPNDNKVIGTTLRALGFDRRLRLSLHQPPELLLQALQRFVPNAVVGYPNVLLRLGEAIRRDAAAEVEPRVVVTHSEVLSEGVRMRLGQLWRAPVRQLYDCHECNLLAWDCPEGHGLHCCDDSVIVEVLRDGRPAAVGKRGEVVITSLHSHAMPFIRFAMHDIATRGPTPCPCGAPFATIRAVEGRLDDLLVMPDGRWLHPSAILDDFDRDGTRWALQYRLVQERKDRLVFSVVPARRAGTERLEEFRRHALAVVGPQVEVIARFVDHLDTEPSGKFRTARSLVPSGSDAIDWPSVQLGGKPSLSSAPTP